MKKQIVRYVIVTKTDDPINWWNGTDIANKIHEILEVSEYRYAKIKIDEERYGWVPLDVFNSFTSKKNGVKLFLKKLSLNVGFGVPY